VTVLTVGELVTVRPMSVKTIERQRARESMEQQTTASGIVIRQPFNFIGTCMTIEELRRDSAYCRVHDLRVRMNVMCGKPTAEIPRKYLKRMKKLPR